MTQELNQVKALVYNGGCFGDNQSLVRFSVSGFAPKIKKQKQTQSTKLNTYINKVTVQREQATIPFEPRVCSFLGSSSESTKDSHDASTATRCVGETVLKTNAHRQGADVPQKKVQPNRSQFSYAIT